MKITITGDIGSGKSSVGRLVAERYGFQYTSTGSIQRRMAEEMGLTPLQLNQRAETDPSIDERIDAEVRALGAGPGNIVIDSRMAWHFIPDSYKVLLLADLEIAARRIIREGRPSEAYATLESAISEVAQRKASENARFMKLYQANVEDLGNYDLVVDTSAASVAETVDVLVASCDDRTGAARLWAHAKGLFPTGRAEDASRVAVLRVRRRYFIYDGHAAVSAALRAGVPWVPVEIAGEDECRLPEGVTAAEYVEGKVGQAALRDWEEAHGFVFAVHPLK